MQVTDVEAGRFLHRHPTSSIQAALFSSLMASAS